MPSACISNFNRFLDAFLDFFVSCIQVSVRNFKTVISPVPHCIAEYEGGQTY